MNSIKLRSFIQQGKKKIGRYGLLLLSMLFMIALRPFLDALVGAALLVDILFTCFLMSGIYALGKYHVSRNVSSLFVVVIIVLKIVRLSGQYQGVYTLQVILELLFFLFMLLVILRHLFTEPKVTLDVVMGSACAFVLLGFVWAHIYFLLELAHPDSFKSPDYASSDHLWDFIYYSFVTLTTLGYGDMLAVTNQARGLSVLEAIIGQLYLTIMVGRLVGLHSQDGTSKHTP